MCLHPSLLRQESLYALALGLDRDKIAVNGKALCEQVVADRCLKVDRSQAGSGASSAL